MTMPSTECSRSVKQIEKTKILINMVNVTSAISPTAHVIIKNQPGM